MATTYARMNAAIRVAVRQVSWPSAQQLAGNIRRRRLATFRTRGDGTSIDDFMRVDTIEDLLALAQELDLLVESTDGTVTTTARGRSCISSDDAFARQIRSSVKSYLDKKSLPLETVIDLIQKVRLPDVPDATTIYSMAEKLNPKPNINEITLRKILYLLSCAGGLARTMRVHYT